MVKLTDKYLSAVTVSRLSDKKFKIIGEGSFEKLVQRDGTEAEKLVLPIELSDGTRTLWVPNNTSIKKLRKIYGDETKEWVGETLEFDIVKQNVRGEMVEVIYVK